MTAWILGSIMGGGVAGSVMAVGSAAAGRSASGSTSAYAQLITVLLVFVAVLGVTAFTTKWIADYQKKQNVASNLEVLDTIRLANNKWLQIVRVGDTYKVLAICKDTVTFLGEVPKEQLREVQETGEALSFKDLLNSAIKRDSSNHSGHKDKDT